MNPNEFQNCFKLWIESVTERTKGQVIAIDGKTLRRSHDKSVDGGHGRIETRKYAMASDIDWLHDKDKWAGLKSIGMVESTREIKGECSHEKRYYISSLKCDTKYLEDVVFR